MNVIGNTIISYVSPALYKHIPSYLTTTYISEDCSYTPPPYMNVTICKTLSELVRWISIQSLGQWHDVMIEYVNRSRKTVQDPMKCILLDDIYNELLVVSCTLDHIYKCHERYRTMWICRDWRIGNVQNMHKDLIVSISIIHKKLELCDFIQDRF